MNKPTFVIDNGRLRRATPDDHSGPLVSFLERHSSLWMLRRVVVRRLAYSKPVGSWWTLNRSIIDSVSAEAERAGARVVFLRIPAPGTRPDFKVLHEHMARTNKALIDLGRPGRIPSGIFFPLDGHINAAGHRYVSDSLVAWINANLPRASNPEGR